LVDKNSLGVLESIEKVGIAVKEKKESLTRFITYGTLCPNGQNVFANRVNFKGEF
jgi:hypothetical protein